MTAFSDIKALALDLDGTLLRPDNTLSGRTIAALKSCKDRGLKLLLCTGRSPQASELYRSATGMTGPMVYFNGAEITDMPDGKPFYPALVGKEVIDFCADISREQGFYFQAYFPAATEKPWNIMRSEKQCPETDLYRKHTGTEPVICDIKQALSAPDFSGCIKGMFLTAPENQEGIRARLLERFGSSIYITRTLITFLEVMATGISKGEGLKPALKQLGLSPCQAMAFGDEESDLPLFGIAGVSAAPANAKDRVKEAADIVIGTNAEDGAAEFLERTFLQ